MLPLLRPFFSRLSSNSNLLVDLRLVDPISTRILGLRDSGLISTVPLSRSK